MYIEFTIFPHKATKQVFYLRCPVCVTLEARTLAPVELHRSQDGRHIDHHGSLESHVTAFSCRPSQQRQESLKKIMGY